MYFVKIVSLSFLVSFTLSLSLSSQKRSQKSYLFCFIWASEYLDQNPHLLSIIGAQFSLEFRYKWCHCYYFEWKILWRHDIGISSYVDLVETIIFLQKISSIKYTRFTFFFSFCQHTRFTYNKSRMSRSLNFGPSGLHGGP